MHRQLRQSLGEEALQRLGAEFQSLLDRGQDHLRAEGAELAQNDAGRGAGVEQKGSRDGP